MNFEQMYNKTVDLYKSRTPKSQEAYEKALKYIAGGETRSVSMYYPYPITVAYGKGSKIYDLDGNEYIDVVNNYTSLIHGHAHPKITEAINRAAAKGTAAPAGIEEQVELAELLCERIPGIDKVRFCNSGTEATLFAIRAARAFTGKDSFIKAIGGYHGSTDQVEFSSAIPPEKASPREDFSAVPDSKGISINSGKYVYAVPYNDLISIRKVLEKNSDKIAAIIIEPFLGAGGVIPATLEYLTGLRELTTEFGILLIFDEVQSLRLSTGGAQKRYGVIPDLTAIGKIIGGGLPVGAFGGRSDIMDVYNSNNDLKLSQSGTFNGNRISMAAGIQSLRMYDESAYEKLEQESQELEKKFEESISKCGIEACITRAGSIINIHFLKEKPTDYLMNCKQNKKILKLFHLKMMEKGIFIAPRGMFVLSTVLSHSELAKIADSFENTLYEIKEFI